jgi:hypothetical protein
MQGKQTIEPCIGEECIERCIGESRIHALDHCERPLKTNPFVLTRRKRRAGKAEDTPGYAASAKTCPSSAPMLRSSLRGERAVK